MLIFMRPVVRCGRQTEPLNDTFNSNSGCNGELVAIIQDGHSQAESALRNRTHDGAGLVAILLAERARLRRYLIRRCDNLSDADDALQELWIRLATLQTGPIANPVSYLFRMASNLVADRGRKRRRREHSEQRFHEALHGAGDAPLCSILEANSAIEDREALTRVAQIIDMLPPRSRAVFRRHRIDGLSHAEISAELGISRSAVEQNMATALRHLARAYQKEA
jgi:RNA polymerase sigma factor (sigma-70 family)